MVLLAGTLRSPELSAHLAPNNPSKSHQSGSQKSEGAGLRGDQRCSRYVPVLIDLGREAEAVRERTVDGEYVSASHRHGA